MDFDLGPSTLKPMRIASNMIAFRPFRASLIGSLPCLGGRRESNHTMGTGSDEYLSVPAASPCGMECGTLG